MSKYIRTKDGIYIKENPDAHPKVIEHWKKVAEGKVPFGYKIKK